MLQLHKWSCRYSSSTHTSWVKEGWSIKYGSAKGGSNIVTLRYDIPFVYKRKTSFFLTPQQSSRGLPVAILFSPWIPFIHKFLFFYTKRNFNINISSFQMASFPNKRRVGWIDFSTPFIIISIQSIIGEYTSINNTYLHLFSSIKLRFLFFNRKS